VCIHATHPVPVLRSPLGSFGLHCQPFLLLQLGVRENVQTHEAWVESWRRTQLPCADLMREVCGASAVYFTEGVLRYETGQNKGG
jgi:hypothetical protein